MGQTIRLMSAFAALLFACSTAYSADDSFGGTRKSTTANVPAKSSSTAKRDSDLLPPLARTSERFGGTRKEKAADASKADRLVPKRPQDVGSANRAFDVGRDKVQSRRVIESVEKKTTPAPPVTQTVRVPEEPARNAASASPTTTPRVTSPPIETASERELRLRKEQARLELAREERRARERAAERQHELDLREAEIAAREDLERRQRRGEERVASSLPPFSPPVVPVELRPAPPAPPIQPIPAVVASSKGEATSGGWLFAKVAGFFALVGACAFGAVAFVRRRHTPPAHEPVPNAKTPSPYPFGAEIGSSLSIAPVTFIGVGLFGSIASAPPSKDCTIVAISRLLPEGWDRTQTMHRLYINLGDAVDETERYLQVYSESGVPKEIVYYTRLKRVYVASEAQQRFFSGDDPEGIGSLVYFIPRTTLEKTVPADVLSHVGDVTELEYVRAIGSESEEKIDTIRAVETFVLSGTRHEARFMPYVRTIGEGEGALVEHLFISYEASKAENGRAKEAHVDFMIGIPIRAAEVMIA